MVEGLGSSTIIEPHPESCHDSALFLFDALLQHSFTEQIYMYILIQIPRSPGPSTADQKTWGVGRRQRGMGGGREYQSPDYYKLYISTLPTSV